MWEVVPGKRGLSDSAMQANDFHLTDAKLLGGSWSPDKNQMATWKIFLKQQLFFLSSGLKYIEMLCVINL